MQAGLGPRGGGGAVIARRTRKGQLRSGKAIRARVTRCGFDAQRKTGSGGRLVLMASQQMERTAELQNLEVRAELNRHVRECERKCFASGRLGSIQQARGCARQQATREQDKSQGCVSRGSSTREQENPEGREGISVANQFGSIVLSHGPRHLATSIPRRSFKRDRNISRKLVNLLIEPLRIPSLKHRRCGKADYRCRGSP
jgi:hypothetical protein